MAALALLTLLLLLLLTPLFLIRRNSKKAINNGHQLLPSPPKLPLIGNLHQLGSLPHRSLCDLSRRHGDLLQLRLGRVPTLLVSSPAAARDVMKTHDLAFAGRPHLKVAHRLIYNSRSVSFSPYGAYWRNARKVCVLHLLSARRVQSFRHAREDEVAGLVAKVARRSAAVDLSGMLNAFTIGLLCRVALGKDSVGEDEARVYHEFVEESSALLGAFHVEDFFPSLGWLSVLTGLDAKIDRTFKKLDGFIDAVLEKHVEKKSEHGGDDAGDLVDILLSLQNDENLDFTLTRDDVKAIIMNMFVAGTGTSFIFLEWAMSELMRNPSVMAKLQQELRGIAGEKKSLITEEHLRQMLYLKAVIKEVLRLHPPAPLLLPRESIQETQLQGYKVSTGTRVIVNAWAMGRDPRLWDAPEEFRPERFANTSSALDFKGQDFEFIPFGGGRRICPGMQFAVASIELALANLVYHFDWKMPDGRSEEELNMEEAPGLTMHRKTRLFLVAEHHQQY